MLREAVIILKNAREYFVRAFGQLNISKGKLKSNFVFNCFRTKFDGTIVHMCVLFYAKFLLESFRAFVLEHLSLAHLDDCKLDSSKTSVE